MTHTFLYSTNELFPLFSFYHVLLLTFFFGAAVWMIRHADFIRQPKANRAIRLTLIITIITQQFMLYGWYYANGAFDVHDALPLYPCRLSTLFVLLLLIRMNDKFFPVVFYWGIVGAVLAMLSPDTEGIGFPNIMFIQFFLGHGALLLGTVFLAITSNYRPTFKGLRTTYFFSFIYFVAMLALNQSIGSNYAYLSTLPPSPFLEGLPAFPIYVPFLLMTMFLLFYGIYAAHRAWYKRFAPEKLPISM